MSAEMPDVGKKLKPLGIQTQEDFKKQNMGMMESVKINPKEGTLEAKKPKKTKSDESLIGPR